MNSDEIKSIIEELLQKLSAEFVSVDFSDEEGDGVIRFAIKTNEPDVLIGRDGITLLAMNHVVRKMAEKEDDPLNPKFIIDVNDYQKNKLDELKQKAKMMAERARFFKSSIPLEPMSSYERMIVHSFLSVFDDLATESAGEGPLRHVVIKYKDDE
ncbi:MAG: R3H domain-containing nucleic acid-binding protein [Candidatus Paceibacterota bacterium]|jgi:spoIIIJ-associated protein